MKSMAGKTISPRARRYYEDRPRGPRMRLAQEYHTYKQCRDTNGMLAIEVTSVLDGHFAHVQRFLDFYRDVEWSGWLSGV